MKKIEKIFTALGTINNITLYFDDIDTIKANNTLNLIEQYINDLDNKLSIFKDKKVTSITIESSREDTRYINAAKDTVINNIITKQSLDVDTVSGATMSSNGIIDAVANALNISFTNPNDTLNNKGQHHNRPNK